MEGLIGEDINLTPRRGVERKDPPPTAQERKIYPMALLYLYVVGSMPVANEKS